MIHDVDVPNKKDYLDESINLNWFHCIDIESSSIDARQGTRLKENTMSRKKNNVSVILMGYLK